MDWRSLFLTAEGRIGRRDFWIGFAMVMGATLVLNMIPVLGQIIGLLLLWPQICLHAKRLHDMGRTAWLMVFPFAIATGAMGMAMITAGASLFSAIQLRNAGSDAAALTTALSGLGAAGLVGSVSMLVGLAFLLWVGLSPGQSGLNRFGAEPSRGPLPAPPPAPPLVEP
jgi:uncharacterized membrane protein YhaH (DUF805 family)